MSYGSDVAEQFRRAAGYVDRILKGEKPADSAGADADQVRARDQSENRECARNFHCRQTLLARADEVIE